MAPLLSFWSADIDKRKEKDLNDQGAQNTCHREQLRILFSQCRGCFVVFVVDS